MTPTIRFGWGALPDAAPALRALGDRPLLVTGSTPARAAPIVHLLGPAPTFCVTGEPDIATVERALTLAHDIDADCVITIGGGSAIDTGKAVAMLLANGGAPLDYLEVIGRGQPITRRAAPMAAIPTTAGTGTEVTRNAVLSSPAHRIKVSLRDPLMVPALAIVDPALTVDLPRTPTISSGLDALTQVLEPFVSRKRSDEVDAWCREGLRLAGRALHRVIDHPHDRLARTDMARVSLLGGLALSHGALGAAHGFAGPLGGMSHAPHGQLCAAVLPAVMRANLARADADLRARFDELGRLLCDEPHAEAAIAWVTRACALSPRLAELGVTEQDIPEAVEKSASSSSMRGNPVALDATTRARILIESL